MLAFNGQVLCLVQFLRVTSKPFVGSIVVELVQEELHLAGSDAQAQMVAGDCFQRVGFVENDGVIIGQECSRRCVNSPSR